MSYLILFFVMCLLSLVYYVFAGLYIIKDSKAIGYDTKLWAIGHFVGGLFILTLPLGIYLIIKGRKIIGIFWIMTPFLMVLVLSFIMTMFATA